MNWKLKAALAQVLSRIPAGRALHSYMQRHVTKTLPLPEDDFNDRCRIGFQHADVLRNHFGESAMPTLRLMEFGAGWDLIVPQILFSAGVRHQLLLDLTRLCAPDLVANATSRINTLIAEPSRTGSAHAMSRLPPMDAGFDAYLQRLGITYDAPADASRTGLPDSSIDAATTSLVLEHVPAASISAIYRELFRIVRPDGIVCSSIDMSDHFSHGDPRVTPWNFLTLEESAWQLANADLIYQNRLRGSEQLALLQSAGFAIIRADERINASKEVFDAIRPRFVAPFAQMSAAELIPTQLYVVARRP